MQQLAELDLPHLPVEDPAFGDDPMRYFTAAREKHPWLAASNIGYFVHEYSAIRELLGRDDQLQPGFGGIVEQLGAVGTPWGRFTESQLISLPAEKHKLLREVFAKKFTPRFANHLRPIMQSTIRDLLDRWAPRGAFDFEEFASYFPISVMFQMVGADVSAVTGIRDALETLGLALSMDKSRMPAIQDAYRRLENLVVELIAHRREHPQDGDPGDLLNLVLQTADDGLASERELTDLVIFFFVAGYDTSKNVLTFTMYLLLQHPEIYRRCAEDLDYCQKVMEESFRYFNPGTSPRVTETDILFRDVLIPKDTMLMFPLNISGRDDHAFIDPERFDPDRKIINNQRHIAFSLGKHMCLGQYIARAQLQEALHQIARRLKNPRLVGEIGWRPFPGIWGIKGLPITFDAPVSGANA